MIQNARQLFSACDDNLKMRIQTKFTFHISSRDAYQFPRKTKLAFSRPGHVRATGATALLEMARSMEKMSGVLCPQLKKAVEDLCGTLIQTFDKLKVRQPTVLSKEEGEQVFSRLGKRIVVASGNARIEKRVLPSLVQQIVDDAGEIKKMGFTGRRFMLALEKISPKDLEDLLKRNPRMIVSKSLTTTAPSQFCRKYKKNYDADRQWLQKNITPSDGKIGATLVLYSFCSEHSKTKPAGRAPELLSQYRKIKSWVQAQLQEGEPSIASMIANASFHKEYSVKMPYGCAPELLARYRRIKAWVQSQLKAGDGKIAATIATSSFASQHSDEKPYGNAPELLRRYRQDKSWLRSQLSAEDGDIAATIANRSFTSKHTPTAPHGTTADLLDRYRRDKAWIESQLFPDDGKIAAVIANSSFLSKRTEKNLNGNAPTLLAQYRADRAWALSQLGKGDETEAALIAKKSFASKHSKDMPHGIAPALLAKAGGRKGGSF